MVLGVMALAGCGGGDDSPATYAFVTPTVNSSRIYSETVVDNSNNSIAIGYSETVTAVNSDGSYSETTASTTGNSSVLDGTNYAQVTELGQYDSAGKETSYVYTASDGTPVTCTYSPHGAGPNWPVQVGQTWSLSYTLTCGTAAPVTYTQAGSVVDVESVTVTAGTYSAIKFQSTLSFTESSGTTLSQSTTTWRDVTTSQVVQEDVTITVSGTAPATGYAVKRTIVLESTS